MNVFFFIARILNVFLPLQQNWKTTTLSWTYNVHVVQFVFNLISWNAQTTMEVIQAPVSN
jgi:hypothetical protein